MGNYFPYSSTVQPKIKWTKITCQQITKQMRAVSVMDYTDCILLLWVYVYVFLLPMYLFLFLTKYGTSVTGNKFFSLLSEHRA